MPVSGTKQVTTVSQLRVIAIKTRAMQTMKFRVRLQIVQPPILPPRYRHVRR